MTDDERGIGGTPEPREGSSLARAVAHSLSFWGNILRIPVELLQIPFDTLDYGLSRIAHIANQPAILSNTAESASVHRDAIPVAKGPLNEPAATIVPQLELLSAQPDQTYPLNPNSLQGDALKLVRSRVLFVKRDYEFSFPAQEDLFADDLEPGVFEAWKIAEFVQQMADPENAPRIPASWSIYLPAVCRHANGRLRRFPADDNKYLRVFFEVLKYYPRESLRYHERELKILSEIAKSLTENPIATDRRFCDATDSYKKGSVADTV
jgi:hypothetical protein